MSEIHDPAGLPQFCAAIVIVSLVGAALAWAARRHRRRPFAPFWAAALERPQETWLILMATCTAIGWCVLWAGGSRPYWDQ